ncbi:MAG: reverse transcriptase family protein [Pirellulaceae bacterium]
MGLWNWLKTWLRPHPITRNIANLEGDHAQSVTELVDTSGGPLKPHHQRLAVRDVRFLPKPQRPSSLPSWSRPAKPVVFSKTDAQRFFSASQRTKNRQLRDLASDTDQLQRYGLPEWNSEDEVAAALGLTVSQLRHYSIHRQRETSPHYVMFAIRKQQGGHRIIHAPKRRLKKIQRMLLAELVSKLPVSEFAHGFRRQRSVATNAAPHVGKAVVIKLDLADCFPSLHFGRVRGLLIALGYSYVVATTLAIVMTEAIRQPVEAEGKIYYVPVGQRFCVQGAPTSPGLCNAILMRLDRRLAGLAAKHGFQYSRYADDLTLSGDDPAKAPYLVAMAGKIIRDEGFRVNRKKTRVLRPSRRQQITGVVVNQHAGLSRTARRRLRAAIHQLSANDTHSRNQIIGKIAYLRMLNPDQAAPLQAALDAKLQY